MNLKQKLESLNACNEAIRWVDNKDLTEAWAACERGDWMLWLYARSKNYEKRKDILARGYCAQLAIPHMKDARSIDAVYAAINYGNGHTSDEQLRAAAYAAYAADAAAYAAYAADAAHAAAYAAYAAADAAHAAAYAAYAAADAAHAAAYAAADAAYAAYAAADAPRMRTLKECADICRKHLPMPIL